jgi:hypothetical protein
MTPERIAELREKAPGNPTFGESRFTQWHEMLDEIERLQYRCPKCSDPDKFPKFHNYDCECQQ